MANRPVVLIVEDERPQMELLAFNLGKEGLHVVSAADGEEALIVADETAPDVILLDWMLPNLSGIEVCRRLRDKQSTQQIPIIMLTARGEEADRIRGLDTGADDYVVKPYSVGELVSRVRAMLRRTRPSTVGQVLSHADISLDAARHRVERDGVPINLGPTEFRLLSVLMERPGRVFDRDQLLDLVWSRDSEIDHRTVDVHIGRLRKALRKTGGPDPIRTVRGTGYAFDPDR